MVKKISYVRKSVGKYGSESTIYCATPAKPKLSTLERLRIARFYINLSQNQTNPKNKSK